MPAFPAPITHHLPPGPAVRPPVPPWLIRLLNWIFRGQPRSRRQRPPVPAHVAKMLEHFSACLAELRTAPAADCEIEARRLYYRAALLRQRIEADPTPRAEWPAQLRALADVERGFLKFL